jgi:hypothetical protein
VSLAALGPLRTWCGSSLCVLEALRRTSSGATMTIPGGAGTSPMRKRSFLRARRTGFYQGSELSRYGAPALRFAPSRSPKPSRARARVVGCKNSLFAAMQRLFVAAYTNGPGCISGMSPRRRYWTYRGGAMLNFALTAFSEVHPPFGGHIVCLKRKMVKTAAAKTAKRLIKNGTTERRSNLSNGSSLRALSTASSATPASRAATHAIER